MGANQVNDDKKIDWKNLTQDEVWEHAKTPFAMTPKENSPGMFCCYSLAFCAVYDDIWIKDENSKVFLQIAGLKSPVVGETSFEIEKCPFCGVRFIDGFSRESFDLWEHFFIKEKANYYGQPDITNRTGFSLGYYKYSLFYCSRIEFLVTALVKKMCCLKLETLINDPLTPFLYIPWLNYLAFGYVNRTSPELLPYPLNVLLWLQFCPFCAHEFGPKNLYFQWGKLILNKFGINVNLLEYIPFPSSDEKCVFGADFDRLVEKLSMIDQKYKMQEWWQGWRFAEKTAECGPACCEYMEMGIYSGEERLYSDYRSWARQYFWYTYRTDREGNVEYPKENMPTCPYCNTELPKSLLSEWRRITEGELGVYDMPYEARLDKIPEEFRTEEWWVKRGL